MPAARLFVYTHIASIGGLPLAGGCVLAQLYAAACQLSFFPSVCDPYDFLYYHPGRQTGGTCIPAHSTVATDFFRVFLAVFASIKESNRIP